MAIEGENSREGVNYSVRCETCVGDDEQPILLVTLGQGLNVDQASQVAGAHRKQYGEDHKLTIEGWDICNESLTQPQPLEELSKDRMRDLVNRQISALAPEVGRYESIGEEDYDISTMPVEYCNPQTKSLSFILTQEEIDASPEPVFVLLDRLGISNLDEVKVWFNILGKEEFKWGISPTKPTEEKLGITFHVRGIAAPRFIPGVTIIAPDRNYQRIDNTKDFPLHVRNVMETYNDGYIEDENIYPLTMGETIVHGVNWMLGLIEKRKKVPQERIVYDAENGFL